MDWGMVFAIIGANVGLIALLATMMLWIFSKLDSDISNLSNKLDAETRASNARMDQFAYRMDQFSQMFIELVKQQKTPKTDP